MIRRRYDPTKANKILVGMIMSREVCSKIAPRWTDDGLFDSPVENIIATMVVGYFRRYNTVPNGQMVSLFESWSKETVADESVVSSVEKFLVDLNERAKSFDDPPEYILDIAGRHFNKIAMDRAVEAARMDLRDWRVEEAQERFARFRPVNLGVEAYYSHAGDDFSIWEEALSHENVRPLVGYREALQEFLGDAFQRGTLHAFMAPDKTGKTTWLIDLAYRAVRERNKVAFFDTGDSNLRRFTARLAARTLRKPARLTECSIPVGWDDDGTLELRSDFLGPADPIDSWREFQKISKNEKSMRSQFYPSSSVSVDDLDAILEIWDLSEDWRPDVVIIDYADILAPPKGFRDSIDQIDETWKRLKRMSQQRHCLVVTATQSASTAYRKDEYLLGRGDFSGRKTKLAHVDGMLGINVSSEEKDCGAARINWIVRRDKAVSDRDFVRVAGCPELCNPAMISTRRRKKNREDGEHE